MRLCVFCGSRPGARAGFVDLARDLGRVAAEREIEIVYGGASVGLMGAVADGALAAGGRVVGVIPRALVEAELAHGGLSALHVVATMHERKALMAELSHGFVALPGGLGTLDELFEILTWAQLGLHEKPIAVLDTDGFFAPLLAHLDHATAAGLIDPRHRAALRRAASPGALLDALFGPAGEG